MSASLVCYMVSPLDRGEVWGELPILDDGASWTSSYYSDTRDNARVRTNAWGDYLGGAWLRLARREGDEEEILFTGFPSSASLSLSRGMGVYDVELKSALYALSVETYPPTFTVGEGALLSSSVARVLGSLSRPAKPYRLASTFSDYQFSSTRSYSSDKSLLGVLDDLCSTGGARVDCDPDGTIAIARYVAPSARTPGMTISTRDRLATSDGWESDDDALSMPSRSAVKWKDGDDETVAWADLPSSNARSAMRTGVNVTEMHELQDLPSPATQAHAQELANEYLQSDSQTAREWGATLMWRGLRAGDVVSLDVEEADAEAAGVEAGRRKCLVKSVDTDLSPTAWTQQVTLKEVG